jgi:hypothetical protein
MTIQTPTRITIEVHQPNPDEHRTGQPPTVHVFSDGRGSAQPVMAGVPREDQPTPAAFDPGECRCLDAEPCNADHAND